MSERDKKRTANDLASALESAGYNVGIIDGLGENLFQVESSDYNRYKF